MKSLIILGRQPFIGLAELESIYGHAAVKPAGTQAALLDVDTNEINFVRLGGSIKLCKLLNVLDTINWPDIETYLGKMIPEHLQYVPEGKFKLGLSTYGLSVSPRDINATGLRLKKIIKAQDRSVRIIPNKAPALNSAQVLHNQLTTPTGWELVLVRDEQQTILGLTAAEQDIDAYARRDQNRPMRDPKVGMLPPKLAQILINLANPATGATVLDPFCGTGVVLQEAALMGLEIYGTDVDKRMVSYTIENLKWLNSSHGVKINGTVEQGDSTTLVWHPPIDSIVSETFLGKPLTSLPPRHVLDQIMKEPDLLNEKFLQNIARQLKKGAKLALAVPAWKQKHRFLHLRTLDHLKDLGYTRLSFVHASYEDLIYHRPDQIVARELVVLEKS
ncbi:methyltransferase domain-containing protein [Candidatus Saccharibacteria bacterium]|nr:methyltransferase domain-containing protein [Candidatus Saccharibacteria bacterium]